MIKVEVDGIRSCLGDALSFPEKLEIYQSWVENKSWLFDQVKEPPTNRICISPCFEMKSKNSLMEKVI
jgi:hypothetical protein